MCGTDAFEKEGTYENCPVCGWTDDVYQEPYPNKAGVINFPLSLNRAREEYLIEKLKHMILFYQKTAAKHKSLNCLTEKHLLPM